MREQIGSGLTAAALGSRNSRPINAFVNFKAKPIQTSRPQNSGIEPPDPTINRLTLALVGKGDLTRKSVHG
jgi:hypothetical protein